MSSIAVSSIVFACVFGGAIVGMSIRQQKASVLRADLTDDHLNTSRNACLRGHRTWDTRRIATARS
jgi:hypothetical protein